MSKRERVGVVKHGLSRHPAYSVYSCMRSRCYRKSDKRYYRYGARGIRICHEWLNDIGSFINWAMENGYRKGLQIDRINNDGHYSPENCRFVTNTQNQRNRCNTMLTMDDAREIRARVKRGDMKKDIAADFGVSRQTIRDVAVGATWKPIDSLPPE